MKHAIIQDFFGKLGAVYARLNILAKPLHIFNVDETSRGVSCTQAWKGSHRSWMLVLALPRPEMQKKEKLRESPLEHMQCINYRCMLNF